MQLKRGLEYKKKILWTLSIKSLKFNVVLGIVDVVFFCLISLILDDTELHALFLYPFFL
jgi:hypothetical protein